MQYAGVVYFLGWDGFYSWSNNGITPIGKNRVDNYVLSRLSSAEITDVIGLVDYSNQSVLWLWNMDLSGGGNSVSVIRYSVKNDKWTEQALSTALLNSTSTSHYGYTSALNGGAGVPYWLTTDFTVAPQVGPDKAAATMDFGVVELTPGRRTTLHAVKPIFTHAGGDLITNTMSVATYLDDWALTTPAQAAISSYNTDTGTFQARLNGRYHGIRYNLKPAASGGTATLWGVEIVDASVQGKR